MRQLRFKHPRQYLERSRCGVRCRKRSAVTRDDVGFEFMLNALRLTEGVPASLFAERTGHPITVVQRGSPKRGSAGLLDQSPLVLKPTPLGKRFLNDLQQLFLAA